MDNNQACDGQHAGHGRPPPHPFKASLEKRRAPRLDRSVRKIAIEVVRERQRGRIAFVGLLCQAFQADCFQIARHARLKLTRRHRVIVEDLYDSFHQRLSLEWRPTGQHLVQDGP